MNGRSAGDAAADGDPVDLATKPVLEWTADDWARWAEGAIGPAVAVPEPRTPVTPRAAPEPETQPVAEVEIQPAPPEAPVAEPKRWYPPPPVAEPEPVPVSEPAAEPEPVPVAGPEAQGEAASAWWASRPPPELEPAPVPAPPPQRTVPPESRAAPRPGRPAHRRQAPPGVPVERRLRSAAGLLLTSVVMGAVLASLVTVALFVTTVVLQGLTG
ncbi:MAG TPA: hypothetical protein VM264_01965 [Acidimicrobiales bacterium]|nr:hypothetical protein [Acidimicrobiales bacterium]